MLKLQHENLLDPIQEATILSPLEFARKIGLNADEPTDGSALRFRLVREFRDQKSHFIPDFEGFWPLAHNTRNEIWLCKMRVARGPSYASTYRKACDHLGLSR